MAPNVSVEPSTPEDVEELSRTMREDDRKEIMASGGLRPHASLRLATSLSEVALTIKVDGEVLAIFGVQRLSLTPDVVLPWALTSGLADRYKKIVFSMSKLVLAGLMKQYPIMFNYVDARYGKALRWAKRIGFTVASSPEKYGLEGRDFYKISIGGA